MKKLIVMAAVLMTPFSMAFAASETEARAAVVELLLELAKTSSAAQTQTLKPGSEEILDFAKGLGEVLRITNEEIMVKNKVEYRDEMRACYAILEAAALISSNVDDHPLLVSDQFPTEMKRLGVIEADLNAVCPFDGIDTDGKVSKWDNFRYGFFGPSALTRYKVQAVDGARGEISQAIRILQSMYKTLNPEEPQL